ncbi:MAG: alanine racemase [Pseudomonadota bacterium]|nr:alanine racemase [Pseudomonadota bacterium]
MNEPSPRAEVTIPPRTGAVIAIDLKALQRNYRLMARTAAPAQCAASLKANAYGIGLAPAARALHAAGCRTFFVAFPAEGRALRKALQRPASLRADVYVLAGLLAGQTRFYDALGLRPILSSPAELAEWIDYCRGRRRKLPAGLHVETGMNRLAFTDGQLADLAAASRSPFGRMRLSLIMSHLACAEEPDNDFNETQRRRFDALRALLPTTSASLANSAGVFLGEAYRYDLVRPGIALYGGNPVPGRANPCEPVVRLLARILQVRDIPRGAPVGYGNSWSAPRASRVAVLGAGYADGYPRSLTSPPDGEPARVGIGGLFAPLIGRVSMDMITVDVTDLPASAVDRGGTAELIGARVTVDEVAAKARTNTFEILSRLGTRCPRLYSAFDSYRGKRR